MLKWQYIYINFLQTPKELHAHLLNPKIIVNDTHDIFRLFDSLYADTHHSGECG